MANIVGDVGDGPALRAISGAATDVGRVRRHNEDTFLVRDDLGVYLVADGMGGHQAGDVASAMVRLSISNFFEVTEREPVDLHFVQPEERDLPSPAQRLVAAIRKANDDIFAASSQLAGAHGMGSTVVAGHMPPGDHQLWIAHVGDSRCYRIRGGQLELLTMDHSLVNEALALDPDMTEEELARLPSNIITRALGLDEGVDVDVRAVDVVAGDTFLLCSDGLSGLISNDRILEAIRLIEEPAEVCDILVALANDAGGLDNITAVVLKV